ncbi:MAG: hypothetical protein KDD61_04315 [Bdellovibrionales bacterium]|nr:hypothetical protein [Bdellovibrionales bacterium]
MINKWYLSEECLKSDMEANSVSSGQSKLPPCGCGVKLDLINVVYPTLSQIPQGQYFKMRPIRIDAFVGEGEYNWLDRVLVDLHDFKRMDSKVVKLFSEKSPSALVELYSSKFSSIGQLQECAEQFSQVTSNKLKFFESVLSRTTKMQNSFEFGKGHSISGGHDFILLDFLAKANGPSSVKTVANNDTIITADSLLTHFSQITVFTAINNALNDLFIYGISDELKIYPVYDGSEDEVLAIQSSLKKYQEQFQKNLVNIQIFDKGPLNLGVRLVGATVLGRTSKRVPELSQLQVGHEIIATRPIGDLALLSHFKEKFLKIQTLSEADQAERLNVLKFLSTPNIEAAKVIRQYLPDSDEAFDELKHIFVSTDISGPGLQVLEDAAKLSKVTVNITGLNFIDSKCFQSFRPNYTSSTNGPMLISAKRSVLEAVIRDLNSIGMMDTWKVGEVVERSVSPIMAPRSLVEKFPINPFSVFREEDQTIFEKIKYL